jgi:hypothetical protein
MRGHPFGENSNRQERVEVDELSGHCHGTSGLRSGSVAKGMTKISYRGYRFPPEIIRQTSSSISGLH